MAGPANERPLSSVFEIVGGAAVGLAGLAGLAFFLWGPQMQGTTTTSHLDRHIGSPSMSLFVVIALVSVAFVVTAVWDAQVRSVMSIATLWSLTVSLALLSGIAFWGLTDQISVGLFPAALLGFLVASGVTVQRRQSGAAGRPSG